MHWYTRQLGFMSTYLLTRYHGAYRNQNNSQNQEHANDHIWRMQAESNLKSNWHNLSLRMTCTNGYVRPISVNANSWTANKVKPIGAINHNFAYTSILAWGRACIDMHSNRICGACCCVNICRTHCHLMYTRKRILLTNSRQSLVNILFCAIDSRYWLWGPYLCRNI
jgi:hypothetical protein